jgi:hypothetical protein
MKKVERLAVEYSERVGDHRQGVGRAFEAGFRAARDMMVAEIEHEIGPAGLDTVGCRRELGEELD